MTACTQTRSKKTAATRKAKAVNLEHLDLMRQAVMTKVAFWDTLHALEVATAPDGEWDDRVHDAIIEAIDNLASCCGDSADESSLVRDEDLIASFGRLITSA